MAQERAPLYRVFVVQGSARAINYRNLKSSTEIELKGTVLAPGAKGEAKVKSDAGTIHILAKVKDLPKASTYGNEYLTYVLWGISPEGRSTNLGELVLSKGEGKVNVIEPVQTFALVVTAEPYFAVSMPSDVVVMENVIGKEAQGQVEQVDAQYELLKRGQYTADGTTGEPLAPDEKMPFEVYQARNAVRIARAAGAQDYAEEAFKKAVGYLNQAETLGGALKERTLMAREAVQRAEDARLIAVQRQDVEHVADVARLNQHHLDEARDKADQAASAEERANQSAKDATDQARVAGMQTQAAESENANLESRLLAQLNSVLATRATARGLIVNMSGMLFQTGKASLQPAAREKLAKIAGILSTHKGLKIEVGGYTDNSGGDAFNQRLSEQRAQASKDYLVSQGVPSDAIASRGFGKENPIASNGTVAGRQENRRVELIVSGEGLASEGKGL
jgi:outer membrane protein OmpA-like peptidoglycan-associated protein